MHAIFDSRRAELESLCREFHVRTLEVFGSLMRDDFDAETSDMDFLVEFEEAKPEDLADRYFGLKDGLESLFRRKVDLVMPEAIRNRYFLESVNEDRSIVYAA